MSTSPGLDGPARAVLVALPGRGCDLARLQRLADGARLPVVTVIGKYNHGKSRLLNELMGRDAFAVADRRETVALSECVRDGVRWLDAPGLDADVEAGDDDSALRATWLESDIRLFVHAVTAGELDVGERTLLASLLDDAGRTRRQVFFVLSQVDQAADERQLQGIEQAIAGQVPTLRVMHVSVARHRQGVDRDSVLMQSRSGIPDLRRALGQAVGRVAQARAHEAARLLAEMLAELQALQTARSSQVDDLVRRQAQQRDQFDKDLAAVLERVAGDIRSLLAVAGPDHSLTPDTFADQFRLTPGKRERNRLQVGYSKACIEINAVLIRHGVTELPQERRTAVQSLDNVMVAVMGVYVKYRKDLQRIFCEPEGREHMRHEFARYFELSSDRGRLRSMIAEAEAGLRVAALGLTSLEQLRLSAGTFA